MSQPGLQAPLGGPPVKGFRTILVGTTVLAAGYAAFFYGLKKKQERKDEKGKILPGSVATWEHTLYKANHPSPNAPQPAVVLASKSGGGSAVH